MSYADNEDLNRENILFQDDSVFDGGYTKEAISDPCGYYAALATPSDSTQKEIRRAFLHLSQSYHTDKHVDGSEEIQALMNDRFQQLMEAYSVLSDEGRRAAYDASGKMGLNRLALVPKEVTMREDVLRHMKALEREAELLKLSKLHAAKSSTVVSFSVEHLMNTKDVSNGGEADDSDEDDAMASEATGSTGESPQSNEVGDESGDEESANEKPSPPSANVAVREVELDGKKTIILIPTPEMQQQLRQRMHSATGDGGDPPSSALAHRRVSLHEAPLALKVIVAMLPRKLHLRHSVYHYVSQTFSLRTRMEAEHQGVQSSVKCTTVAVYQPNPLSLYSISWCFSVARLHITCAWERLLNSLWRVKSKLVLFDGRSLIPTYELSLRRLLAAGCEIENTWIMSRKASGAFKTVVGQLTPQGVQRGLQLLVGYRTLNISLFSTTPTVWGDGEATRGKSSRGLLEHSVSVDPLRGVAQVGFSAWYFCSKWNRVGVGFSTVLPCSYGIMKYASLFVDRPDYLSINELLLLFARGDHIIRVPIVVFQSPQVQLALMWLTAPVLLYRIARFIMRPYQSFRTAALYRQNRLLHRAEMDVARASAQHEQQALQNSALRSRMAEESIGGLIIVNAKYGVLYPRYPEAMVLNLNHGNGTTAVKRAHIAGSLVEVWRKFWRACTARTVSSDTSRVDGRGEKKTEGDEESETCSSVLVLDVTVPLQCLVRDSQLTLPEGPKDKIVGFTDTDPFTDERKHLKIVYRFQHRRHMVVVSDGEAVRLPQREHLMDV